MIFWRRVDPRARVAAADRQQMRREELGLSPHVRGLLSSAYLSACGHLVYPRARGAVLLRWPPTTRSCGVSRRPRGGHGSLNSAVRIPASAGSLCKSLTGCDLYALCGGRSHSVSHSVRVDRPVFGPALRVFLVPRFCCAGRGVAVDGADVDVPAPPGFRRESERFALVAPPGWGFPESRAHRNALR